MPRPRKNRVRAGPTKAQKLNQPNRLGKICNLRIFFIYKKAQPLQQLRLTNTQPMKIEGQITSFRDSTHIGFTGLSDLNWQSGHGLTMVVATLICRPIIDPWGI